MIIVAPFLYIVTNDYSGAISIYQFCEPVTNRPKTFLPGEIIATACSSRYNVCKTYSMLQTLSILFVCHTPGNES